MDTSERINTALEMMAAGSPDFAEYLQALKKEDPLAFSLVEVDMFVSKSEPSLAIKKGVRIIPLVADKARLARFLFMRLGIAYRLMGEMRASENYFIRALEIGELMGNRGAISRARLNLFYNKFCRAEYKSLMEDILKYRREFNPPEIYGVDYLTAVHALISGRPEAGLRLLNSIEATGHMSRFVLREGISEMRGIALRLMGRLTEAAEILVGATQRLLESGSAYAVFPLAKAFEITKFAGGELLPQGLICRCRDLARKGGWGERAAAAEIDALLLEDDAHAAEGLFESAQNYHRAYQNVEAHFASLASAYLAWQTESPIFPGVTRFLATLIPMHPGFKKDPIFGRFQEGLEMLLVRMDKSKRVGIVARLIGEFQVSVGGRGITMRSWQNDKAIKAFLYLLLSPRHRLPKDHLSYLLWPDSRYNSKTKHRLHVAVSLIRRYLEDASLLVSARDFYQLEGEVWTDLEELEGLLRRADATVDPGEKEELLSRARELAQGDLLPEFPYDRYIDEYRQYYERLRKRLFGN